LTGKDHKLLKLNPEWINEVCYATNQCPYFQLLSMTIQELHIGSSLLDIDLQHKHLQPFGVVHGGVFASIIDAAAFWAVFPEISESDGMTTVDLKINYLAPSFEGRLIAKGNKIKLGRTLALGEARVYDTDEKLLAHGVSTLIVTRNVSFDPSRTLPKKFLDS
jgi:uncharacterized protein (TIGR00369 family)